MSVLAKRSRTLRGYLLADEPQSETIITVELYCKWYSLYLLHPDGRCVVQPFPDEKYAPAGESAFVDHVPNPKAVENYAKVRGLEVGGLALELITGRWYLEAKGDCGQNETTIQQARECSVCKQTWPCRC